MISAFCMLLLSSFLLFSWKSQLPQVASKKLARLPPKTTSKQNKTYDRCTNGQVALGCQVFQDTRAGSKGLRTGPDPVESPAGQGSPRSQSGRPAADQIRRRRLSGPGAAAE